MDHNSNLPEDKVYTEQDWTDPDTVTHNVYMKSKVWKYF